MLLIHCPHCREDRPEPEFRHAGEAHRQRPEGGAQVSDEAFADFLYLRDNPKGAYRERWRHIHGCGRFFNTVRDTVSDRFLAAYPIGGAPPPLPAGNGAQTVDPDRNEPADANIDNDEDAGAAR